MLCVKAAFAYAAENAAAFCLDAQILACSPDLQAGDGFCPVFSGKEVSRMRTYEVRIFVPAVYVIEADDEEDVLKRVAEVYKRFYTKDFQGLIEPLVQPEDVK